MDREIIMFIVESGDLENKAALLVKSLILFLGVDRENVDIVAIKPRSGTRLNNNTLSLFRENNVKFYDVDLNKKWDLPFANQAYASAYVEENYPDSKMIYLDTDIVCLNNPIQFKLDGNKKLGILADSFRNGNVSIKYGKRINKYWTNVAHILNLNLDKLYPIKNSVDGKLVYTYFNTGIIIEQNTKIGIFKLWKDAFENLALQEYMSKIENTREYRFIDQVVISLLISNKFKKEDIEILPREFHFQFGKVKKLYKYNNRSKIDLRNVTFLHYHSSFYNIDWKNMVLIEDKKFMFLMKNIPLPSLQDNRRNIINKIIKNIREKYKRIVCKLNRLI